MSDNLQRKFALDQELFDSVRLIKAGLGQVQCISMGNDFYHLPLLTLASGFERFMKVTLCFRIIDKTGDFPKTNDIPAGRKGHDLILLLEKIRDECFLQDYLNNVPVAPSDLDYLQSEELTSFLTILSNFGQSARYYNLDLIIGRNPSTQDPEHEWQNLETKITMSRPKLFNELRSTPSSEKLYEEINTEIVIRLERFARAISRLYTIGRIGKEAKMHLGKIKDFLHLVDENLGKNKYSTIG